MTQLLDLQQSGLIKTLYVPGSTLSQVTTANFINSYLTNGQVVTVQDIIYVYYSGGQSLFTVSIGGGNTTLSNLYIGGVNLPVNNGDFAVFSGTAGVIADNGYKPSDATKVTVPMLTAAPVTSGHFITFSDSKGTVSDSGYVPSNPAKTTVAMLNAAPTSGHVATFSDSIGTLQDGGALGQAAFKAVSDNSLTTVPTISGSTIVGNFQTSADTAGTVQDSGYRLISGLSTIFGGGGNGWNFNVAGADTTWKMWANLVSFSNNVGVAGASGISGQVYIYLSDDPGANTQARWYAIIGTIPSS